MRPAAVIFLALSALFQTPAADDDARLINVRDADPTTKRGVVGSVHDFSAIPGGMANACNACHVPHLEEVRLATTQPAVPTSQPILRMYRVEGQRKIFVPGRYTPGPASLVCLGCHDGTVAMSTIGSAHAMLAGVREGFHVPEGFVWRDHPIGIPYPQGRRDYRPMSFVVSEGRVSLPDGRLECISCHDPHNRLGLDGLLVKSNRRSALCLTCHIK